MYFSTVIAQNFFKRMLEIKMNSPPTKKRKYEQRTQLEKYEIIKSCISKINKKRSK
jgi:hypothetical protein